jgi:hypothetical protein
MALGQEEWHQLTYSIQRAREMMKIYDEYSEPWTKNRLELEGLLKQKKENRSLPKVGDLITDVDWPDDGIAIVLAVKDRRKTKGTYLARTPSGTHWFDRDYIEHNCYIIST